MEVLSWNIFLGGKGKEVYIVNKINEYNADLVVLTEYKNNESGGIIKGGLDSIGYTHCIVSSLNLNKNGVAVFCKTPITIMANDFSDKENIIVFGWNGLKFISVFCANDELTARFINNISTSGVWKRTVIIGDLNTGPRGSKPDRYDDLNRIVKKGFIDLWRESNMEICWSYQSRHGKSQPDHVLCSSDLIGLKWKVKYDFTTIVANISDHALMQVTFEDPL
jgi:exodeoxyribonuclease-3